MVKKSGLVVSWDKLAYASLQRIYEYIRQDSPANADKVREEILKIISGLAEHTPNDIRLISSRKVIHRITEPLKSTPTE